MIQRYDFVIVGAGVFGLSTVFYLSMKYPQFKYALIQQYQLQHHEGSSHSQSRIIRSTYNHQFYRDLCLKGIDKNWPQPNPFVSFVQNDNLYEEYKRVVQSSNGQLLLLQPEQVKKRFPSSPKVQMNKPIFFDTKAGIVLAQNYISSLVNYLKKQANVTIYQKTTIQSFINNENIVKLKAIKNNYTFQIQAKKASLSCGRWIHRLVPVTREIVKQVRQTVSFWQMKNPQDYTIGKFPAWTHFTKDQIGFYGLPDVGKRGLKYAVHSQDHQLQTKYTQQQFLKITTQTIQKQADYYFKNDYVRLKQIQKCYYTVTKTQDFLIDWSDEHENVLICSPCSGHGFKFGPIIGQIVSDLLHKDQSIQIFQRYRYLTRLFYHLGVNLQ